MGPQHIAAENPGQTGWWQRQQNASMGPQHIAAENGGTGSPQSRPWVALQWGRSTSLRKTRGNTKAVNFFWRSFNGAAAHRCGKQRAAGSGDNTGAGFNGAAAHRCGKRHSTSASTAQAMIRASMGPQHIAAENVLFLQQKSEAKEGASMGPQHIAAENNVPSAGASEINTASMGPQHIAAENSIRHLGAIL